MLLATVSPEQVIMYVLAKETCLYQPLAFAAQCQNRLLLFRDRPYATGQIVPAVSRWC